MKLISMTDFVLERAKISILPLTIEETFKEGAKITNEIFNYANFLKQPLKLEMFVPCDEDGNVLEEPFVNYKGKYCRNTGLPLNDKELEKMYSYNEAKEKILFEGFKIYKHKKDCIIKDNEIIFEWLVNRFSHTGTTIETLTLSHDNFNLTPNAIKQIGL